MGRRSFSREFKLEAVKLVRDRGVSVAQAARDLDLHQNMLRNWVRDFAADPAQAFPGQGQMKPEQAEIERLRREVQKLKAEPNGAYIEIEGHTDNAGSKDLNYKLGLERAESVKRYLYEQHQVPLHKISVISYGEEKPIAPNNTKTGRAQNRRVVIKVLT